MSRINIIIIGLLSSIFLIFLCISLHTKNYYAKQNPQKVKSSFKRLSPKPKIPLKDRERNSFENNKILPNNREQPIVKDNNITLLGSEKITPLKEPKVEENSSIPTIELKSLENNLSLSKETLFYNIQLKIFKLLKKNQIMFKKNSNRVTLKGKRVLDKIYTILDSEQNSAILEIQGHTDARGEDKINQWISQKRAEAVKEYLIKKGIPAENIEAEGFGESRLLLNISPYSRRNRRVEIYIKRRQ